MLSAPACSTHKACLRTGWMRPAILGNVCSSVVDGTTHAQYLNAIRLLKATRACSHDGPLEKVPWSNFHHGPEVATHLPSSLDLLWCQTIQDLSCVEPCIWNPRPGTLSNFLRHDIWRPTTLASSTCATAALHPGSTCLVSLMLHSTPATTTS